MNLVERKDKRLGEVVHVGLTLRICEHLRINSITIGLKHQLDLGWIDDTAIQLFLGIVPGFLVLDRLNIACISGHAFQLVAFQNGTSVLCSFRFDTIDTGIYIDTVNNRALQGVVNHTIVVEESHCLRNRCGCQAYQSGSIEIFQNFTPVTIDGTVTLIDDNQIKEVGRELEIAFKLYFACCRALIVIIIVRDFLACQQRKKTLNGGNDNIAV